MQTNTTLDERPPIEPIWLMPTLDVVLVFIAFGIGYVLRYEWQFFRPVFDPSRAGVLPYVPYALFYALMLFVIYHGNGLYRNVRGRAWMEEVALIANGVTNATVILLALYFLLQPAVTSRLMLLYVTGSTVGLLATSRAIRRIILARLRTKGVGIQRVIIVGMGEVGQAVLRTMVARGELGYRVIGFLDDNPERGDVDLGRVSGLGKTDGLADRLREHQADLVIITLRWKHYHRIQNLSRVARNMGADVRVVPDIFQLNMRQVQVENLDGIPLLGISGTIELGGTERLFKRSLDVALTLLASPAWGLIFLIVAIAIKLDDKGTILYQTERIGENGRKFRMFKFRSMVPNADDLRQQVIAEHHSDPRHPKIVDDPRITRVGKFLRRTSIDELPNLINVLRGEMSLVGPRPPLPDEVALYENWHRQRLKTIPGITGLWQVSGRSEVPFDEMVLMDIYYIENWSMKYDMQILLMTVPRVLMRNGAY